MTKYRAKPTKVDGIRFHSKKESKRYLEWKLLEHAGQIRCLELQPKFKLVVNEKLIATYIADARYLDTRTGEMVIEDVKGIKTREYIIKRKLFEALYGRRITET